MRRLFILTLLIFTVLSVVAVAVSAAVPAVVNSAQQGPSQERSRSVITIEGESYYVHSVLPGDTFYSLGRLYNVTDDDIKAANPILIDGLKSGQVIKIPNRTEPQKPLNQRQLNRLFDTHIVNQGETAYSISQRYGISLNTLREDNEGFDPAHISIGQVINIRKASQDKTGAEEIDAEMASYRDALNSVSDGFEHYIVQRGDTFYSLSREKGIPVDSIRSLNPETADGLKAGAIIRLPVSAGKASPEQAAALVAGGESDRSGRVREVYPGRFPQTGFDNRSGFKNIDPSRQINVVIMLPLQGSGITADAAANFTDFYQGCLIAFTELKSMGTNLKVDLFNTARSVEEVKNILNTDELRNADIIIGPIYEECFREVAGFAYQNGIIAVSPLAAIGDYPNVFQVAPSQSTKMDKLREELSSENNIIVIRSNNDDSGFIGEITPLLPQSARYVNYGSNSHSEIRNLISTDRENIFVVLSSQNTTVEEILAGISSVHSDIMSRGVRNPVVKVVGNSSWSRFSNVDENLYFKTQVRFVTSYHFDRGNARVLDFYRRYVSAYNVLPSSSIYPYSYRGYDVAKLFVGAVKMHGSAFVSYLNNNDLTLLQTPYYFQQVGYGGKYENRVWPKVCYNRDYTIEVK